MADFTRIEGWLDALIAQLEPAQRRKLLRDVATRIRQQQQQNIRMQKNPDGSAYEPRRVSGRAKKGRVRRQMFSKLRTVRYMKTRVTASTAEVGFDARALRIARVHHYGLRERMYRSHKMIKYAQRQLLGLNPSLIIDLEDILLEYFLKFSE
ncbi:phage virion morphogenesis protein [Atlantibacter hermannii]|uniref:phage virion morphogenesis protein n=1 Tax=Atlantibacter hermannii TaxID=565 RepID=UPI002FF5E470